MNGKINISSESLQEIKEYNWQDKDNKTHKFTSIIILTYNKLEYTKLCIESIRKFTKKGCFEIIVVDNASSDETVKWLTEQEDIIAILNDENKGFPAGCNQGIEIARGESVLLLNNDVIVSPYWLSNLNDALWSSEEIGAVGSSTNSISYHQAIRVNYDTITNMLNFAKIQNNQDKQSMEERIKLVGFSMLMKKSVLDEVGMLDERFSPGNYEDDDLSYRIVLAGKRNIFCKNAFIHHFGSVSFDDQSPEYTALLATNRQKFKEKWQFDPNYSSNIRAEIIGMIEEKSYSKAINVLAIGCGCGATLLRVKSIYKDANLFGIEIDKASGEVANMLLPTLIGNIEDIDLPFDEKFFDFIILGDVIEHLLEPEEVLKKLQLYLKEDGEIITSIPNIMHISVIEELLQGNFTYADAGILDKTHLRFFTHYEIVKMFIRCNYKITKTLSTFVGTTDSQKELIEMITGRYGENLKYQYNAYQYLMRARIADFPIDTELKYLIMRIDNDIEREESIDATVEYYKKDATLFEEQLREIIKRCVVNRAEVYNKIAVGLFSQNCLDIAKECFLKSYEINPDDADTVFNLCYLKAQIGDFKEAFRIISDYSKKNELTSEFYELKEAIEQNMEVVGDE